MALEQEDIRVPVDGTHTLYMRRFRPTSPVGETPLPPVLMVHGMMSNGRIFYAPNGKGLALSLIHI